MSTFSDALVVHLADRDYYDFVLASIEKAYSRIFVSMFLFDIRPARDVRGQALDLAMALAEKKRTGVDVRVLLNGQVSTPELGAANVATGALLESYGVPHRRIFIVDDKRIGSHAKWVIIDQMAVVGSQNWTDDAFNENTEDAVAIEGESVGLLETEFITLWKKGRGLPQYETK